VERKRERGERVEREREGREDERDKLFLVGADYTSRMGCVFHTVTPHTHCKIDNRILFELKKKKRRRRRRDREKRIKERCFHYCSPLSLLSTALLHSTRNHPTPLTSSRLLSSLLLSSLFTVTKRGAVKRNWKRRYFVLRNDATLAYYKDQHVEASKPKVGKHRNRCSLGQ
jgi:hypothetical protein